MDDGDRGDEYNFCPVESDIVVDRPCRPPTIRLVEDAPERQTLEIGLLYRLPAGLDAVTPAPRSQRPWTCPSSPASRLTAGVPRVDMETMVTNAASDHRLRVAFPTPIRTPTSGARRRPSTWWSAR